MMKKKKTKKMMMMIDLTWLFLEESLVLPEFHLGDLLLESLIWETSPERSPSD